MGNFRQDKLSLLNSKMPLRSEEMIKFSLRASSSINFLKKGQIYNSDRRQGNNREVLKTPRKIACPSHQ